MKRFLLVLSLFGSMCSSNTLVCDEDDFTPLERQKMGQSVPQSAPKPAPRTVKFLPTIAVKFDMLIDGDSILYDMPVFTLDGEEVVCQVCGRPPCQIEVTNGKLKCFCFNHIPRKRGSFLD